MEKNEFKGNTREDRAETGNLLLPPYSSLINAVKTRLASELNSNPESPLVLILSMLAEQGSFDLETAKAITPEKAEELDEAYHNVEEYIELAIKNQEEMVKKVVDENLGEGKRLVVTVINDQGIKTEGYLIGQNPDGTYKVSVVLGSKSELLPSREVFSIQEIIEVPPDEIIDIKKLSVTDTIDRQISKLLEEERKPVVKVKFKDKEGNLVEGMITSATQNGGGGYRVLINMIDGQNVLPDSKDTFVAKSTTVPVEDIILIEGKEIDPEYLHKG